MEHDGDRTSGWYSSQPGQGTEGAGHSRGGLRASSAVTIGWVAVSAAAVVALLIVLQVPLNTAVSMLGLPVFIAVIGWACYLRPRDRKSTRLNSSHVPTSYAVFCLNKTRTYTE